MLPFRLQHVRALSCSSARRLLHFDAPGCARYIHLGFRRPELQPETTTSSCPLEHMATIPPCSDRIVKALVALGGAPCCCVIHAPVRLFASCLCAVRSRQAGRQAELRGCAPRWTGPKSGEDARRGRSPHMAALPPACASACLRLDLLQCAAAAQDTTINQQHVSRASFLRARTPCRTIDGRERIQTPSAARPKLRAISFDDQEPCANNARTAGTFSRFSVRERALFFSSVKPDGVSVKIIQSWR